MDKSSGQPLDAMQLFRALLHDLANPLSIIMSSAACLQPGGDTNIDPSILLEKIQHAAQEQKTILEYGKYIGKIAAFKSGDELGKVDLDQVAQHSVARFKAELDRKSIDLEFCIENDLDAIIAAEPSLFPCVVMDALISNALRFSEPGTAIQVVSQRHDDVVEVKVCDQGVGMPAKVLSQLFHMRSRLRERDLDGHIGLGLALPLLKFYLDSCGADIAVTSRCKKSGADDHGTEIVMKFRAPQT